MYILSVVLEKNKCTAFLFDEAYKSVSKKVGEAEDVIKLCSEMLLENGIRPCDVDYIGVAVDDASVKPDVLLRDIEKNVGIRCIGVPFMSAKALGEAYASGDSELLFVKIEDCVECGIVIHNKLCPDTHQLRDRIAHMVIDAGGYECSCGRQGCFEAYVSSSGLRRIAAEAGVEGSDTVTHEKLFQMDTPEAVKARTLYVKYFAIGLTNIINLFQPSEMVLEGSFTRAGDNLMKPMMDIVLREQYSRSMPNKCNIRFSDRGVDVVGLGVALLGK